MARRRSSCHIFGDMDDLAWDLGNPDDAVKTNPIPINLAIAITAGAVVRRRRSTAPATSPTSTR
jgi:hypothetical protein